MLLSGCSLCKCGPHGLFGEPISCKLESGPVKLSLHPTPFSDTGLWQLNWARETFQKEKANWRILGYAQSLISVQLQDNSSLQWPSKLSAETSSPHPLVCCLLLHRNPGSLHLCDRLFYKVAGRVCKTNSFVPDSGPAVCHKVGDHSHSNWDFPFVLSVIVQLSSWGSSSGCLSRLTFRT